MLDVALIGYVAVVGWWLECFCHSVSRHVHLGNLVGLHSHADTAFTMVQDPVESLLSGVFVSSPSWSDAAPSCLGFNAELEWVGDLIRPGYRDWLEIACAKEM